MSYEKVRSIRVDLNKITFKQILKITKITHLNFQHIVNVLKATLEVVGENKKWIIHLNFIMREKSILKII